MSVKFVLSNEPVEPVETKDIYLYFEVQDGAEDEEGNPCPAGMKVRVAKNVTMDAYIVLAAKFEAVAATDKTALIHMLGLDDLFDADKLQFITREEYEQEYGD